MLFAVLPAVEETKEKTVGSNRYVMAMHPRMIRAMVNPTTVLDPIFNTLSFPDILFLKGLTSFSTKVRFKENQFSKFDISLGELRWKSSILQIGT